MEEKSLAKTSWVDGIAAITVFTEQLAETVAFYQSVFDLPVVYADDVSSVFKFGDTLINLLQITQADELVTPAKVAAQDTGARLVFTINVDDVDAMCRELKSRGVTMLNGPMDRPWGIRTASFKDPAGQIWEIAKWNE